MGRPVIHALHRRPRPRRRSFMPGWPGAAGQARLAPSFPHQGSGALPSGFCVIVGCRRALDTVHGASNAVAPATSPVYLPHGPPPALRFRHASGLGSPRVAGGRVRALTSFAAFSSISKLAVGNQRRRSDPVAQSAAPPRRRRPFAGPLRAPPTFAGGRPGHGPPRLPPRRR